MTPDFFVEKSKTGLSFEFGQPQRKCQRRPTLQSMANPAVVLALFQMFCVVVYLKNSFTQVKGPPIIHMLLNQSISYESLSSLGISTYLSK